MPVTSAILSAAPGMLQTGAGLVQSILGASREKKATKQLENLQTPTYTPNKSIMDYYNNAMQRYNVNPYQSSMYQYQKNNAAANTAAGVNALQSRGGAIGGISRLSAIQNDANLKAGVQAEQQQDQRFNDVGNAANMKAGEDRYGFQINQMLPYEKKYSLLSAKAGGGANMLNAGLQNIFGGVGSGSMIASDAAMNKGNKTSGGGNGVLI